MLISIIFLISTGFFLFASLNTAVLALSTERKKVYWSFSAICLLLALYQGLTLGYFHAEAVELKVELMRWQTFSIVSTVWLFCFFINALFTRPSASKFLLPFAGVTFAILITNFGLQDGLRYGHVLGVHSIELLGESGSVLAFNSGPQSYVIALYSFITLGWLCVRTAKLTPLQRQEHKVAIALFLLLIIVAIAFNIFIDIQGGQGLPIAGFMFLPLLIYLNLVLGGAIKQKTLELEVTHQTLEREQKQSLKHQIRSARLAQLYEQSPTPTFVIHPDGTLMAYNQACVELFGDIFGFDGKLMESLTQLYPKIDFSPNQFSTKSSQELPQVSVKQLPNYLSQNVPINTWFRFECFSIQNPGENQASLLALLCHDITSHFYSQQAFEYMAKGVSYESDLSFFDGMVTNLAHLFNTKYAFIGKLHRSQELVTTLAVCREGKKADNFSYHLKGTPCANLTRTDICSYSKGVQAQFPQDSLLKDFNIEGYLGCAIVDDKNRPIGILVVLDNKPLAPSDFLTRIMKIFASRAGAEMQRHQAERQIRQVAYEDYLTRLPNRARAHQYLNELLAGPQEKLENAYLLMADMEQFKVVNDALGHDVGDDILRAVGQRLRNSLPDELFIARIGGDEFAFIYQNTDFTPEQLAQRILSLMERPVSVAEHLVDVSSSIGFARIKSCDKESPQAHDALDIMRHAELALYQAKQEGRSGYSGYEQELESKAKERMQLRTALKAAIEQERLDVHFQPQLDQQGNCYGAEALVRWFDTERGSISPAIFISVAEESGLIHQLGAWVNRNCLKRLKEWLEHDLFCGSLSINVSAWQFALPSFAEDFIDLVQEYQLPPRHLCIELTESGLLTDTEDTILKLNRLREFGLKIALDDFGTGYSSLAYLRDLPIDVLKIDKAFIDELENHDHSPLTESMIAIGHNMKLHVVAEGVETETQVLRLKKLNCDYFQGYFFARPMDEQAFLTWLKKKV